jgi:hypothetical protein
MPFFETHHHLPSDLSAFCPSEQVFEKDKLKSAPSAPPLQKVATVPAAAS